MSVRRTGCADPLRRRFERRRSVYCGQRMPGRLLSSSRLSSGYLELAASGAPAERSGVHADVRRHLLDHVLQDVLQRHGVHTWRWMFLLPRRRDLRSETQELLHQHRYRTSGVRRSRQPAQCVDVLYNRDEQRIGQRRRRPPWSRCVDPAGDAHPHRLLDPPPLHVSQRKAGDLRVARFFILSRS